MKKVIKVVAAILVNQKEEILCALRSPQMSIPNKWEFPGGKVEADESLGFALEREIKEELGCVIEAGEIFHDHTHDYDTFVINLICLKCRITEGTPSPREHSKLIWLKKENLSSLLWAPADIPAVEKLIAEKNVLSR